jgi:hypothetical protein
LLADADVLTAAAALAVAVEDAEVDADADVLGEALVEADGEAEAAPVGPKGAR